MRVILHIDMDCFFSAVEVRENPELKGLPVIVGGGGGGGAAAESGRKIRGVVSTCSYEAREYGIHSAIPLSKAYELCPDAIVLPVRMSIYKQVSVRIMEILRKYADKIEQVGIDEAFLDITSRVQNWDAAREYAVAIKSKIEEKEGLTSSIGIGPNKTIAKIASDFVKPNGLTVVEQENVQEFLAPLPVKKIHGIGPKTEAILASIGIKTVRQLASCDVQKLVSRFGSKYGWRLHRAANGIDESEVEEKGVRKSLSSEKTLDENTRDLAIINRYIDELAESVHGRLLEEGEGLLFKTVAIKVKFDDFSIHTRAKTHRSFHSDLRTLVKTAKELISEFVIGASAREGDVMVAEAGAEADVGMGMRMGIGMGMGMGIRLVGVRVSNLGVIDKKQRRIV
ncbi:MAG: DNA polymerase IV [Methanophagales archaeon]|nr:DNA polymerase IV [Methanophagales archaeon]